MISRPYSNLNYLTKQLKNKNYKEIAKENNVSTRTIQRYLKKFNLTKYSADWSKEELELLIKEYRINKNVYGLFSKRSISSINHKASRLDLKKEVHKSPHYVNQNFFKKWSPEMSYILGFFFSDGRGKYGI